MIHSVPRARTNCWRLKRFFHQFTRATLISTSVPFTAQALPLLPPACSTFLAEYRQRHIHAPLTSPPARLMFRAQKNPRSAFRPRQHIGGHRLTRHMHSSNRFKVPTCSPHERASLASLLDLRAPERPTGFPCHWGAERLDGWYGVGGRASFLSTI